MLSLKTIQGNDIQNYIHDFANLRIQVFKEYPYLYDGTIEYEITYLENYIKSQKAAFIVAFDHTKIIGMSSCLPLLDESEEFKKPFLDNQLNLSEFFYFGESVLDKQYRGQGIGVDFFKCREKVALDHQFKYCCFAAVDRAPLHPKRPQNYQDLHKFWHNRGFKKQDHLKMNLSWKEIDSAHEVDNTLTFWVKQL